MDDRDKELIEECARSVDAYDSLIPGVTGRPALEVYRGPSEPNNHYGYGDWVSFDDYFSLFKKLKQTEDMLSQVEKELSDAQIQIDIHSTDGAY